MNHDELFEQWCCEGHNPQGYSHINLVSEEMLDRCMMNLFIDF